MVQRMRATIIDGDGRTTEIVLDGTPYSPDVLDDVSARVRSLHAAVGGVDADVVVAPARSEPDELTDPSTPQGRRRR